MSGKGIDNSASQVPGNDGRYVIVITRWNEDIVTGLLKGATQALAAAGIEGEQVEVVSVPGAFEIPLACQAVGPRPDKPTGSRRHLARSPPQPARLRYPPQPVPVWRP